MNFSQEFIAFACAQGVLRFGEFTTKAGRQSPYFFNAGLFNDGASLGRLCDYYALAIQNSGLHVDVIFGPAYKGIPLAAGTAIALARLGQFAFPGNVRQLENICHWLSVMAPAQVISVQDLPPEVLQSVPQEASTLPSSVPTPSAPTSLSVPASVVPEPTPVARAAQVASSPMAIAASTWELALDAELQVALLPKDPNDAWRRRSAWALGATPSHARSRNWGWTRKMVMKMRFSALLTSVNSY